MRDLLLRPHHPLAELLHPCRILPRANLFLLRHLLPNLFNGRFFFGGSFTGIGAFPGLSLAVLLCFRFLCDYFPRGGLRVPGLRSIRRNILRLNGLLLHGDVFRSVSFDLQIIRPDLSRIANLRHLRCLFRRRPHSARLCRFLIVQFVLCNVLFSVCAEIPEHPFRAFFCHVRVRRRFLRGISEPDIVSPVSVVVQCHPFTGTVPVYRVPDILVDHGISVGVEGIDPLLFLSRLLVRRDVQLVGGNILPVHCLAVHFFTDLAVRIGHCLSRKAEDGHEVERVAAVPQKVLRLESVACVLDTRDNVEVLNHRLTLGRVLRNNPLDFRRFVLHRLDQIEVPERGLNLAHDPRRGRGGLVRHLVPRTNGGLQLLIDAPDQLVL